MASRGSRHSGPSSASGFSSATTSSTARDTGGGGRDDDTTIACVVESRSREVCIAVMSSRHLYILQVYLLTDTQSYSETIDLLEYLAPHEIVVPERSRIRPLTRKIVSALCSDNPNSAAASDNSRMVFLSPAYFDQDRGAELLKTVASETLDSEMLKSYIFLSATHALVKYIGNWMGAKYCAGSLKIEVNYGYGGRLIISRESAKHLELVSNARTGSQKDSLFGVINFTKTDVGRRLLKATILGPPTDVLTINTRLDLVEAFLHSDSAETLSALDEALQALPKLDKLLSGIATVTGNQEAPFAKARRNIDTLIALKASLAIFPKIADSLRALAENVASQKPPTSKQKDTALFLSTIGDNCTTEVFSIVSSRIDELITESTTYTSNAKHRRLQEAMAIRPGVNGLLDVARVTYLQSVEDIYSAASTLSTTYNLEIRVDYSTKRGYYLSIPLSGTDVKLPDVFIQTVPSRKTVTCSTLEITSLSQRAEESANQALILTNACLAELMDDIRVTSLGALMKAVESIALCDLIFSFYHMVTTSNPKGKAWSRPLINETGPIAIKGGRHPLVEAYKMNFVPNDVFLSNFGNFMVITGANGSGKTTLLKMVAICQILGQCGCFVPCDKAVLSVRDRIHSRLNSSDDMETNLSTFKMEMKDTAYILGNLTDRSLIIIDELGRGTGTRDGLSLAWAVCEALLEKSCFTLFSTHYHELQNGLSRMYGSVKSIHMQAQLAPDHSRLKFLHKATEGPSELASTPYGLAAAAMCGFPDHILEDARQYRSILVDKLNSGARAAEAAAREQAHQRTACELLQRLVLIKDSSMPKDVLRTYLHTLRLKYLAPTTTTSSTTT